MGYADISLRRSKKSPMVADTFKSKQTKDEIVRFRVGSIYNLNERSVCVGRFTDDKGIRRIKFVDVNTAKEDLRECGAVCDLICDECEVRVFDGVERCTLCEETDDIDDFEIRADRPRGEMALVDDHFTGSVKRTKHKQQSNKACGPITWLIVLFAFGVMLKSCYG